MIHEIFEVIKQYEITVDGLDFKIKGKIKKEMEAERYHWEVSHYYTPDGAAGVYTPSMTVLPTAEEAEIYLMKYVEKFTTKGIIKDEYYL